MVLERPGGANQPIVSPDRGYSTSIPQRYQGQPRVLVRAGGQALWCANRLDPRPVRLSVSTYSNRLLKVLSSLFASELSAGSPQVMSLSSPETV
jgi:hypothetical protein